MPSSQSLMAYHSFPEITAETPHLKECSGKLFGVPRSLKNIIYIHNGVTAILVDSYSSGHFCLTTWDHPKILYLGLSPLPATVTTRITTFLAGNPHPNPHSHHRWEGGQPKLYPTEFSALPCSDFFSSAEPLRSRRQVLYSCNKLHSIPRDPITERQMMIGVYNHLLSKVFRFHETILRR